MASPPGLSNSRWLVVEKPEAPPQMTGRLFSLLGWLVALVWMVLVMVPNRPPTPPKNTLPATLRPDANLVVANSLKRTRAQGLPVVIAHAGGGLPDLTFSNSLEALDQNYQKGFRWFELDFEKTADGRTVLLHDWNTAFSRLFDAPAKRYTYDELQSLTKKQAFTVLDISQFNDWMAQHPDTQVIANPMADFEIIMSEFKFKDRVLPGIIKFGQYDLAKKLGYNRLVYKDSLIYPPAQIWDFLQSHDFFAYAAPEKIYNPELYRLLNQNGLPIYLFTVNDKDFFSRLIQEGATGVFTDYLPADIQ